jgi:hypothetical protein
VRTWSRSPGAIPSSRRRPDDSSDVATLELAALADGSLSERRRAELEGRVAASADLRDRLAEQRQALALTRSAAVAVEASGGLRRRIDAVRRSRSTRLPHRLEIAGAAAAAAAGAAIVAVALGSGGSAADFRAALAPTGLAPGARAQATLTRRPSGWEIDLDAPGLPRLANGAFYEAWLRTHAGALVPVGTFNDGRDVTLWAGVVPTRFTTLTVTRERTDGDQTSSGEQVLVGTVTSSG